MAFKMTPGVKGSPQSNSIMNGKCGGPNQPPCPPRFQKEKTTERAPDRSFRARAISTKKKVVAAPAPVKLIINIPKGYKFKSKMEEVKFYEKFSDLSGFKSQEELDKAITAQLGGGGPVKPTDPEGPIIISPKEPVVVAPIKGGGELEASPIKSVVKK